MYRIYLAIVMSVLLITATPKQGNPLPDGTLTIEARYLDWSCDHIRLIPYVDRPGMYYTHEIVQPCYFYDIITRATSALHFSGAPGYVTRIEMWEVYSNGNVIPGTLREIPGWWWTGATLPDELPVNGVYPAPIN